MREILAAFTVAAILAVAPAAQATKPDPEHKVTLCHRTNSNTNPYVVINVDVASVKFEGHDSHEGPVWDPTLKAQHIKWGDIIPSLTIQGGYPFDYPGKNWTAEGQEYFDNGCAPVDETPTPTPPPTTTTPPTTTVPPTTEPPSTTTGTKPPPTETGQRHTGKADPAPSPTAFTGSETTMPTFAGLLLLTMGLGATLWARKRSG